MEKSPKKNVRQLRERKGRKCYTDDFDLGGADDEIEGPQSFDVGEKLKSPHFEKPNLVKELTGSEFNLAYIQQHGFTSPILFKEKSNLGIRIPPSNFSVSDVRTCVGSKRMLDVMDVRTQKNMELTMRQWEEYYEKEEKDRLLNVISLEFSHTKLENYVESPTVVRQLDWVDRVWPRHLKNMQTESTNVMDEMMYPKVQKYCLMSVAGCFTDFHVDFGGTSVWYHILKGAKVFWLIPPTDKNLELYQSWVLSGKQGDTFFGDNVEECGRVYLSAGYTFFIPSGWIHAVFTPKDSLVFGGNFLHSFGIEKQLKIAVVEELTKVPQKFRYPFFTEMLWYTLERYVHCLSGQTFIKLASEGENEVENIYAPAIISHSVHLSPHELLGLKAIVLYLHHLPIQRKNVPALITDPIALLKAVRKCVEDHRYDNPESAVTGRPILVWPGERAEDVGKIQWAARRKGKFGDAPIPLQPQPGKILRPRIRCTRCQSCCTPEDCQRCFTCMSKDHPKKMCLLRECLNPMLPISTTCHYCGMDGWGEAGGSAIGTYNAKGRPSNLMECVLCLVVTHTQCLALAKPRSKHVSGIMNEDLCNSWECPACVEPRLPRFKRKSISEDSTSKSEGEGIWGIPSLPSTSTAVPLVEMKVEVKRAPDRTPPIPITLEMRDDEAFVQEKLAQVVRRKSLEDAKANKCKKKEMAKGALQRDIKPVPPPIIKPRPPPPVKIEEIEVKKIEDSDSSADEEEKKPSEEEERKQPMPSPVKFPFRRDLGEKIMSGSKKNLKRPTNIVRPALVEYELETKRGKNFDPLKDKQIIVQIFKWLDVRSLSRCLCVSKDWNRIGLTQILWAELDLSVQKLSGEVLKACVRRQPTSIKFDWTNLSRGQLGWFIVRSPQLKSLSLKGISWSTVASLKTCMCPALSKLDLSYVGGMTDASLREILAPPLDSRPGLTEAKSRLRQLVSLSLAGSNLSDVALRYVTQHAGSIRELNLSCCSRITDAGIAQIGAPDSPSLHNLTKLSLRGCPQLTNICLDHLKRCRNLAFLDIQDIPNINHDGLDKFLMAEGRPKIVVKKSFPSRPPPAQLRPPPPHYLK